MPNDIMDPVELGPDDFSKWLDSVTAPDAGYTTDSPAAQGIAPASLQALAETSKSLGELRSDLISPSAKAMGMRPGVFLDITTGAPKAVRARLGLDENKINQFKLLNKLYGAGNVDVNQEGRFVLRDQPTSSGNIQDVIVDPIGFEGGDVAQLTAQAVPLIVGGIAARYGLKGAEKIGAGPLGKVFGATTAMSLGTEATGALQDAMVRWIEDNEVNASEIAKERAKMAIFDEALGLAFAGGAKAFTKAGETFLGLGQVPFGTTPQLEAQRRLAQQTGVKVPLTPGEETGSKLLLRLEAMVQERMGSAAAIDRVRQGQRAAEGELRRVFLGLPRTMTDDDLRNILPKSDLVGQKALRTLGAEAEKLEAGITKAKDVVERTGTLEAQLKSGVSLATPLNPTAVGEAARSKVVGEFNQFRGAMGQRYEAFLGKPEIQARIINGDTIASKVAKIESELVPQAVKEKPTGLLLPSGAPATSPKLETLEAFIPAKVRSFIDTLKGLQGAKVSVRDLKQIRTSIDNTIAEGLAIPGTDVAQLMALKTAVADGIEQSLSGMADKTLLPTWQALSADYAKGMSRFDRVGIREMLVKPGERGAVGNTAIAESISGNSPQALDHYHDLKAFFGAGSAELDAIETIARQKIIRGAVDPTTDYLSGNALRANLENTRPEILDELFGINKSEMYRISEALSRAQGNLATEDLVKLASSRTLTASKIPALDAAEEARRKAYNNKLIKAASKGTLDAEVIKPSEFVRYASKMDPDDAKRVLADLSSDPALLQNIRQLAVEDIWSKVQAGPVGRKRVSSELLKDALGSEVQERTWRAIIGNDVIDSLHELMKTTASREFGATAYKTAGAIGAGMEAPRLFMKGEVKAIPEIASRFLLGFLYSGPLKRSVTNLMTSSDRSRVLNAVIASTPFIDAAVERFGSDGAFVILQGLRDFVEPMQTKQLAIEGKIKADIDPTTLSADEFRKWLDTHMQQ